MLIFMLLYYIGTNPYTIYRLIRSKKTFLHYKLKLISVRTYKTN